MILINGFHVKHLFNQNSKKNECEMGVSYLHGPVVPMPHFVFTIIMCTWKIESRGNINE